MISHNYGEESREAILGKIKWLMSLRLVIATFSLGAAALVQFTAGKAYLDPQLKALYLIIGLIYTLNLLYAFVLKKINHSGCWRTSKLELIFFSSVL